MGDSSYSMPPDLELGPLELAVADLRSSVDFYGRVLGFQTLDSDGGSAALGSGDGRTILRLEELPDGRPRPPHTTGLYHFALLLPSRGSLAAILTHLAEQSYPIQGAADHLVSEALYMADPDGNGIELYADRPQEAWPRQNGEIQMATDPLDIEGLMEEMDEERPWDGLPAQTRMGHIHLQVSDLVLAEAFYRDFLGFQLMARYGRGAIFLSAGGYHHHIGLNNWGITGAPPPPPNAVGLRSYTLVMPEEAEIDRIAEQATRLGVPFRREGGRLSLRDPFDNRIHIDTL